MDPSPQFQADHDSLTQILDLLSPEIGTLEEQRQKQQRLNELSESLEFCCYLALIFGEGTDQDTLIRQKAGLALKSQLDAYFSQISPEMIEYCKGMIIKAYESDEKVICETAGNAISLILFRGGLNIWPDIIEFLTTKLSSDNDSSIYSAAKAICFIIEDSSKAFEEPKYAEDLEMLLPALSSILMQQPAKDDNIRSIVIHTINMMIIMNTDVVYRNTEGYLKILLDIIQEDSTKLRTRAVQGLTNILDFRMELALSHYESLFEVMLECLKLKDQEVALASAEFWSGLAINRMENDEDDKKRIELIEKVLPILSPILLECCRFAEADRIASLPFNNEDANVYDENYYEDQEDDVDEEEYSQLQGLSTLRRASAFAFEKLATVSPDTIFESIKPSLEQYLQNDDDQEGREASIVILGAICEENGPTVQLEQHLSTLVPLLFNFLSSEHSKIKISTTWTLSKFSDWISNNTAEEEMTVYVEKLCVLMKDSDPELCESACCSLSDILEYAGEKLAPSIGIIAMTYSQICSTYSGRCLMALLDVVGLFVEIFAEQLRDPQAMELIITPLITKLNELSENDKILIPVLKCVKEVVKVFGNMLDTAFVDIIQKCLKIISQVTNCLTIEGNTQEYDVNFAIEAFPLLTEVFKNWENISSIAESDYFSILTKILSLNCLNQNSGQTEINSSGNITTSFGKFDSSRISYKQNCFSHINFSHKYLPNEILEPYIESILKSLCDSLMLYNENPGNKRELTSIANNACLTIGNIALKIKADIKISLSPVYKELNIILNNKTLDKGLAKHCCFTLGKLGLVDPKSSTEYLQSFIKPWCICMRYLPANVEKYQSFTGICEIIKNNPKAIIETFDFICEAIYEYPDAPEDLQRTFKIILQSFKDNSGESWVQFYCALPQEMQQKLSEKYEI
ncbi:unnamed protein product [Moneuplotes crassus]|uniref:Importin N-terminal domain-containing protein n=1 Tax=Euplotes crassus TaxID=5936 RepID=A0AAD1Y165_EUPCR|nr:unnamed protein product [Moneuplotes crassus]